MWYRGVLVLYPSSSPLWSSLYNLNETPRHHNIQLTLADTNGRFQHCRLRIEFSCNLEHGTDGQKFFVRVLAIGWLLPLCRASGLAHIFFYEQFQCNIFLFTGPWAHIHGNVKKRTVADFYGGHNINKDGWQEKRSPNEKLCEFGLGFSPTLVGKI